MTAGELIDYLKRFSPEQEVKVEIHDTRHGEWDDCSLRADFMSGTPRLLPEPMS